MFYFLVKLALLYDKGMSIYKNEIWKSDFYGNSKLVSQLFPVILNYNTKILNCSSIELDCIDIYIYIQRFQNHQTHLLSTKKHLYSLEDFPQLSEK